jgi:Cu/Ag efflux pump CusA
MSPSSTACAGATSAAPSKRRFGVNQNVKLPPGYYLQLGGEYESAKRANARLGVVVPVTVAVIFFLLYSMFGSFKWPDLAEPQ